jgi:hypothetical protein
MYRILSWIAVVVFFSLGIFCGFCMLWGGDGQAGWGDPRVVCIFLGIAILGIFSLWYYDIRITIETNKIVSRRFRCVPTALAWNEIRFVRETGTHLILHGGPGDPVVKIDYGLVGFERLREAILRAAPAAGIGAPDANPQQINLPMTFHRNLVGFALELGLWGLVLVAGTWLLFEGALKTTIAGVVGLSIAVYEGAKCVSDWLHVTVDDDKITLRALFRVREIPFSAIESVDVATEVTYSQHGKAVQMHLRLILTNRTVLILTSFINQALYMRAVIEHAMEKQRNLG